MALIFVDSFDHVDEPSIMSKYTSGSIVTEPGRHGAGGGPSPTIGVRKAYGQSDLLCSDLAGNGFIRSNTVTVGMAVKFFGLTATVHYLGVGNSGSILSVGGTGDAALEISSGARSSAGLLRTGVWHFIEMQATLTPLGIGYPGGMTIGRTNILVRLDGRVVINAPDIGPVGTFEPLMSYGWTFTGMGAGGGLIHVDDYYVTDGCGPAPWNGFLGDIEIVVLKPVGAGSLTEWIPNPPPDNWDNVDDPTPDEDATYNSADGATGVGLGARDLFEMEDISGDVEQILGVQVVSRPRRTEEGFATVANLIKHAGVITEGHERAVTTNYDYQTDPYGPATDGTLWTEAKVNALEAGYQRVE